MQAAYTVKTEVFEGPLDLLLDLIEKRKLFIGDISLAQVADDYMAYVRGLPSFPTADAARFLLVASTLVLIKSKALLPALELSDEEEGDIAELERRLKLYRLFKEAGGRIRTQFGREMLFPRISAGDQAAVFAPHERITSASLAEAIEGVIRGFPKKEEKPPEAVVRKIVSLEEMIERVTERVKRGMELSFAELAQQEGKGATSKERKIGVVVSFLAMLELVKQGMVAVEQEMRFGKISLSDGRRQPAEDRVS